MLIITNDELGEVLPDKIKCPHCGEEHEVKNTQDNGKPSILNWYKCGEHAYLCGIEGQSIMHKLAEE